MKPSVVFVSVLLVTGLVVVTGLAYGYFLRRRYAGRPGGVPSRVAVLPMFPVTLFAGIEMLSAGIHVLATATLVGAAISIAGGIYLAVFLPYWRRNLSSHGHGHGLRAVVLSMSPMLGLWLIGMAVAVVLVWTGETVSSDVEEAHRCPRC